MTFIFDNAVFSGILGGSLRLPDVCGRLMATSNQLDALSKSSRKNLQSQFALGRPALITDPSGDGDGQDAEWIQNGPELEELAFHLGNDRHPGWETDLEIVEVALNEKAILISDRATLRALMEHFEGRAMVSSLILRQA
jgi:hypothetical protein